MLHRSNTSQIVNRDWSTCSIVQKCKIYGNLPASILTYLLPHNSVAEVHRLSLALLQIVVHLVRVPTFFSAFNYASPQSMMMMMMKICGDKAHALFYQQFVNEASIPSLQKGIFKTR